LVKRLSIPHDKYSVSFQSRLSKNWMTPFTDKNLIKRAKEGHKKVLVAAPAFVADCLETTVEIGYEYKELFIENGGEVLQMVDSLNDFPRLIDAIEEIIQAYLD